MRAIEVEAVDVYCRQEIAGKLTRVQQGARFDYDQEFLNSSDKPKSGIAFDLPYDGGPFITQGVNLHPFFAGLLPEGLRLQAIIGAARTSSDDLFSLLIESGPDCVGDIYVLPEGSRECPDVGSIDLSNLESSDFTEAKRRLLEGARDASIPGVQPKLSAAVLSLPVRRSKRRAASILKLAPSGYPQLVENETFIMGLAKKCGLRVPAFRLVRDREGTTGFLVERFDRTVTKDGVQIRVHQEDACQFLNKYPSEKYRISMREIAGAMASFCDAPKVQLVRLLELYVFSYLIGNADLHAKNISIFRSPLTGLLEITPAYDLVSTLPYKQLDSNMALSLEGKDDNFKADDFVRFFGRFRIPEAAVRSVVQRILSSLTPLIDRLDDLRYEPSDLARTMQTIRRRVDRLSG